MTWDTGPCFVMAALGEPTGTRDELLTSYLEQIVGLVDGGADVFIVKTIFDTLNTKATLFVIGEYPEFIAPLDIRVFLYDTLLDLSGRTLSGQTTGAFYASIRHSKPM